MEVLWNEGISHIPYGCGSLVAMTTNETLITSLSYTLLSSYSVWTFLGTIGISLIVYDQNFNGGGGGAGVVDGEGVAVKDVKTARMDLCFSNFYNYL